MDFDKTQITVMIAVLAVAALFSGLALYGLVSLALDIAALINGMD